MSVAKIKISSAQAWAERKQLIILRIKEVIKKNPGAPMKIIISKLSVNEPYISRKKAYEYLQDLYNTEQIKISDEDLITLCQ